MFTTSLLALTTSLPALTTSLLALTSLLPFARAAPLFTRDVNVGFPYGQQKIRGVNLGGWLVLEPFITPSVFSNTGNDAIVDEYTFGQYQDHNTALSALTSHWDSWYTEDDFSQIAAAGMNHIRIPIGYWAYDISGGEPYVQGQAPYLDKAIGWARNHGLHVIVDLHGAPGSQNGYDNSGHRGQATWQNDQNNVDRTKAVVQLLSAKYSDPSYFRVVTAIAVLNEPATYISDQLFNVNRQYNYDAYGAARYPWAPSADKSGLAIIISDGFQNPSSNPFGNDLKQSQFEDVILDHHQYTVFSDGEVAMDDQTRLNTICNQASNFAGSPLWLVVGEWTLASTDCAPSLNGRGIGSRYNGSYSGSPYVGSCDGKSGDGSDFSDEYKTYMRKFYDTQTQVYENNGQGWIHWTWKTEAAADWSYSAGLNGGWIPWDPTSHIYQLSDLCN